MIYYLMSFIITFSLSKEISFDKQKIQIKSLGVTKDLTVEIAKSYAQLAQGLMFRQKLNDGQGMLFVYPQKKHLNFWMKNTYIDLSIGFFDENKKLVEILTMLAPSGPVRDENLTRYRSSFPCKYALEVPLGWFKKSNIKTGSRLFL